MLTLWILVIVGWCIVGSLARQLHVAKERLAAQEKAHQAALNREFHDAFQAGWNSATTDPNVIRNQYHKIFKIHQQD